MWLYTLIDLAAPSCSLQAMQQHVQLCEHLSKPKDTQAETPTALTDVLTVTDWDYFSHFTTRSCCCIAMQTATRAVLTTDTCVATAMC